jgi:PKD repeat protein
MGEIMKRSALGLASAGLVLVLASGCADASAPGIMSTSTAAGIPTPKAAASEPGPTPYSQSTGSPVQVTVIPLGKNNGVEARLPINGYFAAPGMEITFDASSSAGAVDKYEWDLDGDGTYDATTTGPVLKHTYDNEFEGEMFLRVTNMVGSTHVLKTPVHVSTVPSHQLLAPPRNVQVEVLSTIDAVSEIKVTWESDDPAADSWALAINGFPAGRVEKSARSATVTEIQRDEDVLVEVLGLTSDMALGMRAGTTLPAAG